MKYIFALFLLLFVFIASSNTAYAHVLKTNGSVGAVMHVTPDDDPIAGEESGFYFEFKDKENKFKPENCDCTISILQSGKEIFSQPLFSNNADPSLSNASFSFTFPQRDVYKIKITGKPSNPGEFNDFTLEYDLRVERVSENVQTTEQASPTQPENKNWILAHIPHIIGGFLAVALLLWVAVKKSSKTNLKN